MEYKYKCYICQKESNDKDKFRTKIKCAACHSREAYVKYKHLYINYYAKEENKLRNNEQGKARYQRLKKEKELTHTEVKTF
jgi:DNA-directed RNA polymerase subunit RPC12/RpoP